MSRLLTCLVLVFGAAPATACINDVELPNHEREFRSQYRSGPADPQPVASPEPTGRPSARLLMGTGAVLLAAAAAVVVVRNRSEN
jgi:hypothetical protein